MSNVKAELFNPGEIIAQASYGKPDAEFEALESPQKTAKRTGSAGVERKNHNFLDRMQDEKVSAFRRANALRINAELMGAAVLSFGSPEDLVKLTGEVATKTMKELGFDEANDEVMQQAAPVFVRSAAQIVRELAKQGLSLKELQESAERAVKAMVAVSKNGAISRFAQNQYPDDLDAKMSLRFVMTGVMAELSVKASKFSFLHPKVAALKQASATIAKAAIDFADGYLKDDAGRPLNTRSSVMLMQSLMSNAASLYLAHWDAEAERVQPKIAVAMRRAEGDPEKIAQIETYVQDRLKHIEAAFRDDLARTLKASHNYAEALYSRMCSVRAKVTP